jgi:hypothetical protein
MSERMCRVTDTRWDATWELRAADLPRFFAIIMGHHLRVRLSVEYDHAP